MKKDAEEKSPGMVMCEGFNFCGGEILIIFFEFSKISSISIPNFLNIFSV